MGAEGRGAGTLDAGVHVGPVVVADVEELVAALHRAGEGLEADVVGAAVAAEGDELDVLLGDLSLADQAPVGSFDAADGRGGVLEGVVDPGHAPGGVGIDGRRHLQAAGGVGDDHRIVNRRQHLPHDDRSPRTADVPAPVAPAASLTL